MCEDWGILASVELDEPPDFLPKAPEVEERSDVALARAFGCVGTRYVEG